MGSKKAVLDIALETLDVAAEWIRLQAVASSSTRGPFSH